MAIQTKYFGVTGANVADGSTFANRAALFSAGNWSTVLTGFAFNGTDSLVCLIAPGTYTCSQALASGLFANPPIMANPLVLHGCDNSGNKLTPDVPNWTSAIPVTWDTSLPVINTTTSISTINQASTMLRLLKFTASGAAGNGVIANRLGADWVSVVNSSSNVNASCFSTVGAKDSNIYAACTALVYGASFIATNGSCLDNARLEGNSLATSGGRLGLSLGGTSILRIMNRICSFNHPGSGINDGAASSGEMLLLSRFVVYNCGAGVVANSTASQTAFNVIKNGMVTGCVGNGIDGQAANLGVTMCRVRSNGGSQITNLANYPADLGNDTTNIYSSTAEADAAEYVDAANGNFQIRLGSPIHGFSYGVSDQSSSKIVQQQNFMGGVY